MSHVCVGVVVVVVVGVVVFVVVVVVVVVVIVAVVVVDVVRAQLIHPFLRFKKTCIFMFAPSVCTHRQPRLLGMFHRPGHSPAGMSNNGTTCDQPLQCNPSCWPC
jgi:hypothetical protein